jgi:hypothetical protein
MSLREELEDIGTDTVKQAVPVIVGAAQSGLIAWLRKIPRRMEYRALRREKRREARRKARAT